MAETKSANWQYPEPRSGWYGAWDKFIGPGATSAELNLQAGAVTLAAILLLLYMAVRSPGWTPVQGVVALLLVVDLTGGAVTNATSAAKRWYHRAGTGVRQQLTFIAIHMIQPALVVIFFRPADFAYLIVVYGYLLLAAITILRMPLYLQRPVAMVALMGGFIINAYVFLPVPGLEWFLPVFYLKLLVSHLLHEEPYRPDNDA